MDITVINPMLSAVMIDNQQSDVFHQYSVENRFIKVELSNYDIFTLIVIYHERVVGIWMQQLLYSSCC